VTYCNFLFFFKGFRKIAKTVYLLHHVRLSVHMKQLGCFWTGLSCCCLSIFRKYIEKLQVSLKSDENNGYFSKRSMYIYDNISLNYSYRLMRNFSGRSCREDQYIFHFQYLFIVENREIMWIHKAVRQATDDNIVRYMRLACWITKATDTHSVYVIFIAPPWQPMKAIATECYLCIYSACLVAFKEA
jgi:hypothetical protein